MSHDRRADSPPMTAGDAVAVLFTTVSSEHDAAVMARALVEAGVAACVTCLPHARSVYRWQGEVEEAAETVVVIKTTPARLAETRAHVERLHPYDLPEILAVADVTASHAYAAWVRDNVTSDPRP